MPMDEVIRAIEQTDSENIQDVLGAVFRRYRELYPNWKILFLSANRDDPGDHNQRLLKLIDLVECLNFDKNDFKTVNERG